MSHDMEGKVDKEKEVTDYEQVCVNANKPLSVCEHCVGKATDTHKQ